MPQPQADEGRRQRKKQQTREALIEAALRLFGQHGYDHTAVHEITDAVDVSERTFFRYFTSKEDLVLSFVRDGAAAFAAALEARPAQEEPLMAARAALRASLGELPAEGGGISAHLQAMRLIDATPALLAAYLRVVHEEDDVILQLLARREGVDAAADRRPRVLAAVIGALVYLASRDWQGANCQDPEAMLTAFDAYADALGPAVAGHWSR